MNNSYKDNLVFEFRRYLHQYQEEFKANMQIEYNSCQITQKSGNIIKAAKVIGAIWGIIILAVFLYIAYTEFITPQNIPISFTCYIAVALFVAMIIVFSILFNAARVKRIRKLTMNNMNFSIYITNTRGNHVHQYLLNEIEINIRKRRQTVEHTLKSKTYNVYIIHKKRKSEYLLTTKNELQFFAFVLFYKALCNVIDIENLSEDELYKMYHKNLAIGNRH